MFFVVDKGGDTGDLVALRKEVCERFIEDPSYRIVEAARPAARPSGHRLRRRGRRLARAARRRVGSGAARRALRRRRRRPAGVGRPVAVRQHDRRHRTHPDRRNDRVRVRGRPGHQQRPRAHRAPSDRAQPGGRGRPDHHRAAAGERRLARRHRRSRRDARCRLLVPRGGSRRRRDLLGRVPRHARRAARRRAARRGGPEDRGVRAEARRRKGWIMDTYLLRRGSGRARRSRRSRGGCRGSPPRPGRGRRGSSRCAGCRPRGRRPRCRRAVRAARPRRASSPGRRRRRGSPRRSGESSVAAISSIACAPRWITSVAPCAARSASSLSRRAWPMRACRSA